MFTGTEGIVLEHPSLWCIQQSVNLRLLLKTIICKALTVSKIKEYKTQSKRRLHFHWGV